MCRHHYFTFIEYSFERTSNSAGSSVAFTKNYGKKTRHVTNTGHTVYNWQTTQLFCCTEVLMIFSLATDEYMQYAVGIHISSVVCSDSICPRMPIKQQLSTVLFINQLIVLLRPQYTIAHSCTWRTPWFSYGLGSVGVLCVCQILAN